MSLCRYRLFPNPAILMPMGAVIFADYWLFPRIGLAANVAESRGLLFNWPAFLAWVGAVGLSFLIPIEIFFKALPAWFLTVIIYTAGSWWILKPGAAGEEVTR